MRRYVVPILLRVDVDDNAPRDEVIENIISELENCEWDSSRDGVITVTSAEVEIERGVTKADLDKHRNDAHGPSITESWQQRTRLEE